MEAAVESGTTSTTRAQREFVAKNRIKGVKLVGATICLLTASTGPQSVSLTAATPAPEHANAVETLGTIEASIDGRSRTWFVVKGQAQDGPYASGVWMEPEPGHLLVTAGGFDKADPPIRTFNRATGSLGDYGGTVINLNFTVPREASSAEFSFPDRTHHHASVLYMSGPAMDDLSSMFQMAEGTLRLEAIEIRDGTVRIQGSFAGALEAMDGSGASRKTDGRFTIEKLPDARSLGVAFYPGAEPSSTR
jgi:hypothetical protein